MTRSTFTRATVLIAAAFALLLAAAAPAGAATQDIFGFEAFNVGGTIGYTPFACPTDPPVPDCGARTPPTGTFQMGFRLPTGGSRALLPNDTITFTTPLGTKLPAPSVPFAYTLGWGTADDAPKSHCNELSDPLNGPTEWVVDSCPNKVTLPSTSITVSASGNSVRVTLPFGFSMQPGELNPTVLQVTGVTNPPAGTYPKFAWTIAAGDNQGNVIYSPGFATNEVTLDAADPYLPNWGLEASTPRVRVSATNTVGLTATARDLYGNAVIGRGVVVEVLSGGATPATTSSDIPVTGDDGTSRQAFVDTTAETVQFQTVDNDAATLAPQVASVTFTPGVPDAAHSHVAVVPCPAAPCLSATVPASSAPGSAVATVDLADEFGNPAIQPANPVTGAPASGDEIVLQAQLSGTTLPFIQGTAAPTTGAAGTVDSSCPSAPVVPSSGCTSTVHQDADGSRYGRAQFLVSDRTAEKVTFAVQDVTAGASLTAASTKPTITFLPGAPLPANNKISGPAQPIPADGSTAGTVTVTLVDALGNKVPGVAVALTQSAGGHATVTPSAVSTNAAGQALFSVKDTVIETPSFTAMYSGVVNGQLVSGNVPTSGAGPTIRFVAGGASASLSTVAASPASVLGNGTARTTITVVLVDGQSNVAAGRRVSLSQPAGAHSAIDVATATTDANGVARFTVGDASVESVTYTVTDTTDDVVLAQQPTVAFTSTPSVGRTTLSASPASVPADGVSSSTITATLLDAAGLPIAGKQMCLTQASGSIASSGPCPAAGSGPSSATPQQIPVSGSGCATQAPAGSTDCKGRAQFTVAATSVMLVSYGVADLTDYPTGPALGPHTSVTFTQPTSEASLSSVAANPLQALANTAGPAGASAVTVTLVAPGNAALAGHAVDLHASSSASTVVAVEVPVASSGCLTQAAAGTSDCHGQAQFAVTDSAVETVTYAATDLTAAPAIKLFQQATVGFVANEGAVSTIAADAPTATADGGATAAGIDRVTVTLDPAQPLAGNRVSLTQSASAVSTISSLQILNSSSGCSVQAAAGTSDCNGQVRFKVTDTTVETVTYTAHDDSTGATLAQNASVRFIPAPPVISGLTPNAGPIAGGTRVTIAGSALSAPGQAPTVTFAGRAATAVSCASSSSCTVTAPAATVAGSVAVVLTSPGGTSTPKTAGANTFQYLAAPPTVTKISPTSGPTTGGTTVTVTGTNFATLSATTVRFGTAIVSPATVNAAGTQLTVVSPAEVAATVDITVTTPAGTSAKRTVDLFRYVRR
jgi:hypothetical protein